ncbi:MAG: hypothetical protein HOP20_04720 [Sulfuriferula sp.]|nr:hypothetical protein [Sulfuriferula sp.]
MMLYTQSNNRLAVRQRGSIAVMAVIFLSLIVILLSVIDIGNLFYKKRDLQKVADLAALAGAQSLPINNVLDCSVVTSTAKANAESNNFSDVSPNTTNKMVVPTCGRWDTQTNPTSSTVAIYETPMGKYFGTPKAGIGYNAVKVVVSENVPRFFGLGTQYVVAQAIASQSQPTAAFSLGTGLLSLCSASSPLLNPLVNGLLGSDVCLSAVTYNGLVGSNVSLLGVLANLGLSVGTIDQALNTQVTLAQLVNATVAALSPDQIAAINVNDLVALTTGTLGGTLLTLGDVLNVNAADGMAALDAKINVLDLINVATLQVANKNNFLDLGAGINLGIATVALKLNLIESPKMAVGGVGVSATSAQLRLALMVNVGLPGLALVNLPLYVDLAPGKATLTGLQCNTPQSATFDIQPGLAEVCLGSNQTAASAPFSCPADMSQRVNRVDVIPGVLNLGINASLTNAPTSVNTPSPFPYSVTVGTLLASILGNIITPSSIGAGSDLLLGLLDPVISALLASLGAILNPILALVGGLLDSVLALLGLGVGQSTLNVSSVSCGNVQLVY